MSQTSKTGFPFLAVLGLILIVLKLTEHIDWSWIWVLAPFWIPPALFFTFLILSFVILIVVMLVGLALNVLFK